jgi:hypothetical protein
MEAPLEPADFFPYKTQYWGDVGCTRQKRIFLSRELGLYQATPSRRHRVKRGEESVIRLSDTLSLGRNSPQSRATRTRISARPLGTQVASTCITPCIMSHAVELVSQRRNKLLNSSWSLENFGCNICLSKCNVVVVVVVGGGGGGGGVAIVVVSVCVCMCMCVCVCVCVLCF